MQLVPLLRAAAVAVLASGALGLGPAQAQQPAPSAVAAARELIILKGGNAMFDPIVAGVIEFVKNSYVPTNPQLAGPLNEVAAKLRKDYDGKRAELLGEVAKVYAEKFTEAELKELVAFYKSPLGKKMSTEEPVAIDQSLKNAQVWADSFSGEVMSKFREEMKKKGHDL
ncbi:DUF2059 domain-containing protein [Rhodoplanes sp. TEM]|uniref:DUF2059 domain-containing protein n=1 Tax=Rhodoplanes tepidamans TaxID=200616 RepID=A0ABT5JG56_RHOTP|nr:MULTISPECIES: DUF2059 domain-containing protein [Rhodoplanes]MDC7788557.1 DUF2059 domain-containing protein [Rhodoplanes tepidamans]MDC7985156.1 DUF2059 domain-containing protein [Rhodoplanes sp. TEM]MDQ0353384.1 hypothetical protein [Rhodoplanes tepidamans]